MELLLARLILCVEEAVALLAARRLQHEPLVVGVQDESEEERDAHRVDLVGLGLGLGLELG